MCGILTMWLRRLKSLNWKFSKGKKIYIILTVRRFFNDIVTLISTYVLNKSLCYPFGIKNNYFWAEWHKLYINCSYLKLHHPSSWRPQCLHLCEFLVLLFFVSTLTKVVSLWWILTVVSTILPKVHCIQRQLSYKGEWTFTRW